MSGGSRRYHRTILLGIAAMAALVWVAMDQFGISRREIGEQFLGALLALVLVVAGAGVMAVLWMALRRLLSRSRD